VVESLLAVSCVLLSISSKYIRTNLSEANANLANLRDDDDRLPIHWAVSYGHLNIAVLLSGVKNFDPDVQVRLVSHDCLSL
jgi:ankyrin repeat protein